MPELDESGGDGLDETRGAADEDGRGLACGHRLCGEHVCGDATGRDGPSLGNLASVDEGDLDIMGCREFFREETIGGERTE